VKPSHLVVILAVCAVAQVASPAFAQHQMPPGMTHEEHQKQMQKEAELKKRGQAAMGFDQDATTHQFQVAGDGGSIEVTVKDPDDTRNLSAIRTHLNEVAASFKQGDFSKPFQTHAEIPPGVDQMKALKDAITYTYEDIPQGGRVRIRTSDPDAIKAVHSFLNYQIREHHTAGEQK
jgi:hypothetical protein